MRHIRETDYSRVTDQSMVFAPKVTPHPTALAQLDAKFAAVKLMPKAKTARLRLVKR